MQWDEDNNNGGLGQGNSGAGLSWHSHILSLEKAYEAETGKGVKYFNPDKSRRVFQWLVRFVDDNSIMIRIENLGYTKLATIMLLAATKYIKI